MEQPVSSRQAGSGTWPGLPRIPQTEALPELEALEPELLAGLS